VFPLAAQDRAAVDGTVTDSSGALVGNAKIELMAPATGLRHEAMTSESGIYEITPRPVGTYPTIFR
jgi:hypothetical protein